MDLVGLLPELWKVEIIGRALRGYTARTRVALRLTCRWFHAHVPPVPTGQELIRGIRYELMKWIKRRDPCTLMQWPITSADPDMVLIYRSIMGRCLERARCDMFKVLWMAFTNNALILQGRGDSPTMRWSMWLRAAIQSNNTITVRSYLDLMQANGYTCVPAGHHITWGISKGCYAVVAWLLDNCAIPQVRPRVWDEIIRDAQKTPQCLQMLVTHLLPHLAHGTSRYRQMVTLAEAAGLPVGRVPWVWK